MGLLEFTIVVVGWATILAGMTLFGVVAVARLARAWRRCLRRGVADRE